MIITVMTSTLPIGGHGPPWSFKQILKATGIGWHVWSKTFPRKLMRKCWQISSLQFLQLGPCSTSKLWGQLGQLSIHLKSKVFTYPIGSIYGIYTDIGGILMVNVTTYCIHGSYGYRHTKDNFEFLLDVSVQQWPEPGPKLIDSENKQEGNSLPTPMCPSSCQSRSVARGDSFFNRNRLDWLTYSQSYFMNSGQLWGRFIWHCSVKKSRFNPGFSTRLKLKSWKISNCGEAL